MKEESKLWRSLRQNTPNISWTRLESWASPGVPDCLGYNNNCGFFMVELKVTKTPKVSFSPHQKLFHLTRPKRNFILLKTLAPLSIKLYESAAILGLLTDHREARCLALNDWDHIERLLLSLKPDA